MHALRLYWLLLSQGLASVEILVSLLILSATDVSRSVASVDVSSLIELGLSDKLTVLLA